MRKLLSLIVAFSVFVSCDKIENVGICNSDNVVFVATTEGTASNMETKTYLDENIKLLWHAQDELTIFGSTLNEKFQFDGETGDNSGTFTKIETGSFGSGNPIGRNYAIYPYHKDNKIENDESYLSIPFPAVQYYAEGSIGRGANISIAVTDNLSGRFLSFKNACSFYRMVIYGVNEDYIRSVEIKGRNGEKLSGMAKVTIDSDKLPTCTIEDNSSAGESVILDCGEEGVKIGTSKDDPNAAVFWMAIPPGVYAQGISFTITNTNGDQRFLELKTANLELKRNVFRTANIKFDQSLAVNINKQKERNALIALYNSLGGDSWKNSANWLSDDVVVGEWYGVTTDEEGFVVGIDLSDNNLQGELPVEIGDFSRLTSLLLGDNSISGTLPESICKLTSLEYLYLDYNSLEGELPENMGNLKEMRHLCLTKNNFEGSIPESIWTGMDKLEQIWLEDNKFTGGLTAAIGNAVSLTELRVSGNNFSSALPDEICNLANLVVLQVNYAGITGEIPENIGNLKKLQFVWLDKNNLSGTIPESIGEMTNLIELKLNNNSLRGSIPNSIGNLARLEVVHLQDNMLSGSIPSTIGECANLVELNVSLNRIAGEIPASIGNCTKLQNLDLSENRLSGEVIDFAQLVNLKVLYLAYNSELGGTIRAGILNGLTGYSIEGTKIKIGEDTGLQDPTIGNENMPWD